MRTCITPEGGFVCGIHKPSYTVRNLRLRTRIEPLGENEYGSTVHNTPNYPDAEVHVESDGWIYEIPNPLPFRGATFVGKEWADRSAADHTRIALPPRPPVSMTATCRERGVDPALIDTLPRPLRLSLATTSTDPEDLVRLARLSCPFTFDADGEPAGLLFRIEPDGNSRPVIHDHDLFEAVANNAALPDSYKIAMVIRPGAQGASEIVGDVHRDPATHIYEYLRRNSYIGHGHYAANMAEDAIRYDIASLRPEDFSGLRHLYYQRTYLRLADLLGLDIPTPPLGPGDLESLRQRLVTHRELHSCGMAATLWGWNFGFDFAASGYRLHASHQQVHHQYALIPSTLADIGPSRLNSDYRPFVSGDMVAEVIETYRSRYGRSFFRDYLTAIETNTRMDGRTDLEARLIVWENERALLFVPKAQTSQWELQVMTKPDKAENWPGNILESDTATRASLDRALLAAQRTLAVLGAEMVTTVEFSKRFAGSSGGQPLIYSLLPKLPQSPGAMSEMQLRFINGHYPEDFAAVCRAVADRQND